MKRKNLRRRGEYSRDKIVRILSVILAVFLFYFILFSPFLKIKKINVSGNDLTLSEKIKSEIEATLKETVWLFIPGDNIIFASVKKSEEKIKEKFPEVEEIKVKKSWLDLKNLGEFKLEVEILEKEKKIIWCQECPFEENKSCFYLDEKGVAFLAAGEELNKKEEKIIIFEEPYYNKILSVDSDDKDSEELCDSEELFIENNENENLKKRQIDCEECKENNCFKEKDKDNGEENITCYLLPEVCSSPIFIGEQAADEQFINFVLDLDKKLKQNTRLKIEKYQTKGVKTREIIAYTEDGLKIYFNALESAEKQIGYLRDFLIKGIDKDELSNLEYIYLEAGNKIFYK